MHGTSVFQKGQPGPQISSTCPKSCGKSMAESRLKSMCSFPQSEPLRTAYGDRAWRLRSPLQGLHFTPWAFRPALPCFLERRTTINIREMIRRSNQELCPLVHQLCRPALSYTPATKGRVYTPVGGEWILVLWMEHGLRSWTDINSGPNSINS